MNDTTAVSAIKCWRCSSTSSKFCGDTLNHHNFTEEQLQRHLVRCRPVRKQVDYKGDKMIAKCSVRIDLGELLNQRHSCKSTQNLIFFLIHAAVHQRLQYTRDCIEEAENANSHSCFYDEWFNDRDDPNVKLMTCETCTEEDGCNDKIKIYFPTEAESSVGKVGLTHLLIQPKVVVCLFIILIYSHCKV